MTTPLIEDVPTDQRTIDRVLRERARRLRDEVSAWPVPILDIRVQTELPPTPPAGADLLR